MGGFFKKSGNDRGFFPDASIEEEKSLFTNDDEACAPCSIQDNPIIPNPCAIAEPLIQEVTPEDYIP